MVEKLIDIIINELNKHDILGSCVLAGYLFNQFIPISEIVKGFLIRGEYYCLHMWIKYNNKLYDSAIIQNMRNFDMSSLPLPQYSIEKPNHLENFDDDYEKFYPQLQIFLSRHIITTFLTMLKNVSNLLKENTQKIANVLSDVCHMITNINVRNTHITKRLKLYFCNYLKTENPLANFHV